MDIIEPLLKWAGGKRWLVKIIKNIIPEVISFENYTFVELFAGGAAFSFKNELKDVVLNDINPHLINFYFHLSKGRSIFDANIEFLNDKDIYYKNRERFNDLIKKSEHNTLEAAALFYYLNKTGYNGLIRFNKSGLFNVPFGRYKRINYFFDVSKYYNLIKKWRFFNLDFSKVPISSNSLVYADPPYDVEFTQYSSNTFDWKEQVRLAEYLTTLKVPVILSNQATERIIKLYSKLGYKLFFEDTTRYISCKGKREKAKEVIALLNFDKGT